ncbi:putative membrane protein [Sulfurospirillum multivorans DSM 12446]|uniref:Membrane protein n=2 Tax=Sulfurospirillum multivorans TaxID=66821 RepID=A0AA86AMZ4_SULMK|nr:putative membrane protein [Sulfurospirillum multivorans DSM 12446]QEH05930.1 putative membrane protein [Sulfurospirillum multivorans]
MTLPFLHMSSFILSYFGVLGVTLFLYKSAEISIIALKKIND